jgi:hypothetical protein
VFFRREHTLSPLSQGKFRARKDAAQQIVEIVSNTSCELAHTLELLPSKRLFLRAPNVRNIDAGTEVTDEAFVVCEAGNTFIQNPSVFSVYPT